MPSPSIFVFKEKTARTSHKCCECESVIIPGERYYKTDGLWDGQWAHFHQCLLCGLVMARLSSCDNSYVLIFGSLAEYVEMEFSQERGISNRQRVELAFDSLEKKEKRWTARY